MKKAYRLENLGCAAKMERKIAAVPGVSGCTINFMTTKMQLEADEQHFSRIEEEAARIIKRIEPYTVMKP